MTNNHSLCFGLSSLGKLARLLDGCKIHLSERRSQGGDLCGATTRFVLPGSEGKACKLKKAFYAEIGPKGVVPMN